MATKGGIGTLARRASRLPLARIAGALLGAALAFLCLAMPVELLERIAESAGLPTILPAAAAPLGMKARLMVAILGGGVGFAAGALPVWLLGRAGAPAVARPRPEPVIASVEPEEEPAPLRRRFTARDYAEAESAPRPIFAVRELGVPLDEIVEDRPLVLLPPEPGRAYADDDQAEEDFLDLGAFPIADVTNDLAFAPEVQPDAVPEPVAPLSSPRATPPEPSHSIPALMARLEAGIVRRGLAHEPQPTRGDAPRPAVAPVMTKAPNDMDMALRNALQELHRVAAGRA